MPGVLNAIRDVIRGVYNAATDNNDPTNKFEHEEGDIQIKQFKDEVVSYINEEFERRRVERLPFELQWRLNLNFLDGNQYCDINQYSQSLFELEKNAWWEEREVFNHIAPILETRLAKLGRVQPTMKVRPATSELEDVGTAKVCTQIAMATFNKLNMSQDIATANLWAEVTGTAFYKPRWNPQAGLLLGYLDSGPVFEGDLENIVCSSFGVYPDNCFNLKPRSVIFAEPYHVDSIYDIWGVKVEGRDIDVFSVSNTSSGSGGLGYSAVTSKIASTVKKDCELVLEYYELPTKLYPQGRLIITAGEELLYYGPLPYRIGEDNKYELPIVRQTCIDRPGCFFGVSVIERLIPIQRRFNAVKNRKTEYLNRAAIGILTYEDNSLDEDVQESIEYDGLAPGTLIPRRPGSAAPEFLQSGSLPPEFIQEEQSLEEAFKLLSGVSDISVNSSVPSGASGSGISLEIMKEQDDQRISLTAEHIRKAILQLCKYWLRIYRQYAAGTRIDRLVGKNNEVIVAEWKASDITSDDVVMESENELMQTIAQRKAQVMQMFQLGMFMDPDTGRMDKRLRSKVLEMMDMGNIESADDIQQLHINRSQKENMDIQKAIMPQLRDFDDHEIHLYEHNRFRLGGEYEQLSKERPDLAQLFDIHCQQHQGIVQQIQMQQQAMMMQQQAQKSNNLPH